MKNFIKFVKSNRKLITNNDYFRVESLLICSKRYRVPLLVRTIHISKVTCGKISSSNKIINILDKMPKEPKAAAELRHIRIKTKAAASNKINPPPSVVYLSVLGNGAVGNPRCLYMFTDHTRYIFNCGEGTQRLAHEHKMKLAKLEHLFFTSNSWKNMGGLPGLSLTIQDIGVPEITLHGPPGLQNLFEMTKNYMVTKDLNIVTRHPEEKYFNDNTMRVDYVPLYSNKPEDQTDSEQLTILNSIKRVNYEASNEPSRKKPKLSEDMTRNCDTSVAYICKLHSKPGQLMLEKCVEQGVPPGPLLGVLKNGKDVTLPNGRVVKALDVVSPADPGPVFIVLECPNESFIDSLLNEESFKPYQELKDNPDNIAAVVVHFSPPEVIRNERYCQWMNRFPSSTFHLFLNSENPRLSSTAVHRIQLALNHLDSNIFPQLTESNETVSPFDFGDVVGLKGESLLRFYLRPKKGIEPSSAIKLTEETFKEENERLIEIQESITELKSKLDEFKVNGNGSTDSYPEVVFLGTGSSVPSKVRNVSSIVVKLKSDITMLLDCGEGTLGQLVRFYGKERCKELLLNLKAIFISHLHADHHLGLVNLLQKREEAYKEENLSCPQLDVLAPLQIMWWFINYHKLFEPLFHHMRLIPNYMLLHNKNEVPTSDYQELISKLDLKDICTVEVRHCKNAYGIVFTTNSNFKLVYSGDTMPSENLIKAGQNCSLLIHEATMEDDLEFEAVIKTHSTTSQAIEVGQKMNAKYTLLTHFSQRYAKIPIFNENFHSNVGFAFDNMKVQPSDLSKLTLLIQPLKELFKDHYEDMQEKTAKKKRQKEILESISTSEIKS